MTTARFFTILGCIWLAPQCDKWVAVGVGIGYLAIGLAAYIQELRS